MNIRVNGTPLQAEARTLSGLLAELDYDDAAVATALNGRFVRRKDREGTAVRDGDEIEVLSPRQGG